MATTDRAVGARNADIPQALAVAGLLAGASLSLSRLFESGAWLPPTWLAMAAALGLAALLRRAGAGSLVSLGGMAAGFVLVAGLLLFPDTLVLLVLPTVGTVNAMLGAVGDAMEIIRAEAAPVEVRRELLLLAMAGGWAVTTAADGLVFRARQPLLAIVPALALFAFPPMVRGGGASWYTAWFLLGAAGLLLIEGRARLAGWGRWVSNPRARPAIGWHLPLTSSASTGRWLVAGASVLAISVPWLLPGYGQPPGLNYGQGGGNAGDGVSINPFVSLKTRLATNQDVPLFSVSTTKPTYYRLLTLDRFDGTTFRPSGGARDVEPFRGETRGDHTSSAPVERVEQRITIEQLSDAGVWLPAATAPVEVDAGRDVLHSAANRGITTESGFGEGFEYRVVSEVLDITAADLDGRQSYGSLDGVDRYLETPGLDDPVRELARSVAGDEPDPYRQAIALQEYLRGPAFQYSLRVPDLASGGNQLQRFLLSVREGYCEQFAAAMAVMARSLGIPARVAVGFTPGLRVDDRYVITTRDAHAWPELYFPAVGWVPFEPTPRADGQVSLPLYTIQTSVAGAAPGSVNAALNPSGQPTDPGNRDALQPEIGGDLLGDGVQEPEPEPVTPRVLLAAGALVLLVLLVPAVKLARNLLGRRRARQRPRDSVAESYTEVTRWARDAGIGRDGAETPRAYAHRLRTDFAGDASALVELTGLYVRSEYAADGTVPDDAHRARRLAHAAKSALASRLGWRRRLTAALSPKSLLG